MDQPHIDRRIVLFDGVCNFCDGAVNFIMDRDRRGRFAFAALQSPAGAQLLAEVGRSGLSSIVLIEGNTAYTQSTAALRIARRLDGLWPWLFALILVPKPLRDWAYRAFAANRYRLFGKLAVCRIPTPERRARFLDLAADAGPQLGH